VVCFEDIANHYQLAAPVPTRRPYGQIGLIAQRAEAEQHMFTGSTGHFIWGVAFTALLLAGCVTDIRSRKIPNELVLAILFSGWLFAALSEDPWRAIGLSLAGASIGFLIWIGFYLAGAIGAGDVKFFAAASAWLGPSLTWRAALIAAVAGGVLAIVTLLLEKRLGGAFQRMVLAASSRTMAVVSGGPNSSTKSRQLPYGVALAVGVLVAAWYPRLP
jgi:prepilin peptidase CpaA